MAGLSYTLGENPTQLNQFRLEATGVGLHPQEPAANVVELIIRQRTIVLFQLPFTEEGYARRLRHHKPDKADLRLQLLGRLGPLVLAFIVALFAQPQDHDASLQ